MKTTSYCGPEKCRTSTYGAGSNCNSRRGQIQSQTFQERMLASLVLENILIYSSSKATIPVHRLVVNEHKRITLDSFLTGHCPDRRSVFSECHRSWIFIMSLVVIVISNSENHSARFKTAADLDLPGVFWAQKPLGMMFLMRLKPVTSRNFEDLVPKSCQM